MKCQICQKEITESVCLQMRICEECDKWLNETADKEQELELIRKLIPDQLRDRFEEEVEENGAEWVINDYWNWMERSNHRNNL